ncbi:MAG: hypothetical protein GY793_02790, partial [Proteobacteria bacterium]|nr:hypothetical protein [Pseudomonadota bacterium]
KKADHKLYEKMLENINEEYLKGGFMKERKNFEQFAKECPWRCREECLVIPGHRVCDFEYCGLWYTMNSKSQGENNLHGKVCTNCGKSRH